MSVCDPNSPDYDAAACKAKGGTPGIANSESTDSGKGTWSKPFEEPAGSGRWWVYNSTTHETQEYTQGPYGQQPTDQLIQDLRDLGVVPIDEYANQPETAYRESQAVAVGRDPSTALTAEQFAQNVKGGTSQWLIDPTTGLLYDRKGKLAPEWLQKAGVNGAGGAMTEYQRAALAESQRQNRIAEVQAAQNAIEQRIQNAQQARLAGAKMAITPDMAASGYFPGLSPQSPIVRSGLADAFRFQPVAFNADQGLNINQDQVAKDLATIRSLAGYGG